MVQYELTFIQIVSRHCISDLDIATGRCSVEVTEEASREDNLAIISESGILLSNCDINDFIVAEIRGIHERKGRADTNLIVKELLKKHGLSRSVVITQLDSMIKRGLITKVLHGGRESLRINEAKAMEDNVSSGNSSEDEEDDCESDKENENEHDSKLWRYRNELVEVASRLKIASERKK